MEVSHIHFAKTKFDGSVAHTFDCDVIKQWCSGCVNWLLTSHSLIYILWTVRRSLFGYTQSILNKHAFIYIERNCDDCSQDMVQCDYVKSLSTIVPQTVNNKNQRTINGQWLHVTYRKWKPMLRLAINQIGTSRFVYDSFVITWIEM